MVILFHDFMEQATGLLLRKPRKMRGRSPIFIIFKAHREAM
jgi:hypothetical protein